MIPFEIEQLPRHLKEEAEEYLEENPRSPAARLRPQLGEFKNVWVAFIGPVLREGGVGLGDSPRGALEDFSRHFLEPLVSSNGSEPR